MPDAGPTEIGPLPAEGLHSNDGFLEAELENQLSKLSQNFVHTVAINTEENMGFAKFVIHSLLN